MMRAAAEAFAGIRDTWQRWEQRARERGLRDEDLAASPEQEPAPASEAERERLFYRALLALTAAGDECEALAGRILLLCEGRPALARDAAEYFDKVGRSIVETLGEPR